MPDYEAAARRAAKRYGVDPDVFVAQLKQESGLRPGLTSSAGAQGIAQFIPSTAKAYGVNLHDGRVTDDLNGAAKYMADNLKQTGGNYSQALSIYNSGRPDAYKDPSFAGGQTYNYVKTILGNAQPAPKVKAPKTVAAPQAASVSPGTPAVLGVDNSGLRRQLVGQFLQAGGVQNSNAVLGLAAQYGQAQDVPGVTAVPGQKVKAPSASTPASGKRVSGSKVLELIYNDGGKGYGIKDGQTVNGAGVFNAVWAGHANHVHVAAGPKTVVELGKYAQRLGLNVGENSHFGGVDVSAHVAGSYHGKDEAIDVSAPMTPAGKRLMAKYAKAVAQYNRTKRLPE